MENQEQKIFGNKYFSVHGKKREQPAKLESAVNKFKEEVGKEVVKNIIPLTIIAIALSIAAIVLITLEETGIFTI